MSKKKNCQKKKMSDNKKVHDLALDSKTKEGLKYKKLTIIFSIIQTILCICYFIVTLATPARPGYF